MLQYITANICSNQAAKLVLEAMLISWLLTEIHTYSCVRVLLTDRYSIQVKMKACNISNSA